MVKYMINSNKNYYRGSDFLDESFKNKLENIFNPYEYNLESNLKNQTNSDRLMMKSVSHPERNLKKQS